MICYIHKETKEVVSLPDRDQWKEVTDDWDEAFEEVDNNISDYLVIDKMPSHDAFRVMEHFIPKVNDKNIQDRLSYALHQHKPFQKFKYELGYHDEILQQWYAHKNSSYEDWVRRYLDFEEEE